MIAWATNELLRGEDGAAVKRAMQERCTLATVSWAMSKVRTEMRRQNVEPPRDFALTVTETRRLAENKATARVEKNRNLVTMEYAVLTKMIATLETATQDSAMWMLALPLLLV